MGRSDTQQLENAPAPNGASALQHITPEVNARRARQMMSTVVESRDLILDDPCRVLAMYVLGDPLDQTHVLVHRIGPNRVPHDNVLAATP